MSDTNVDVDPRPLVADVYNKLFDQNPAHRRAERLKKIPLIGRLIDVLQAKFIDLNTIPTQMGYESGLAEGRGVDGLTGLFNSTGIEIRAQEITQSLLRGAHDADPQTVVMGIAIIDINKFKKVNDTLGHAKGDGVIIEIARILQTSLERQTDQPARIGGDEFLVIFPLYDNPQINKPLSQALTDSKGPIYKMFALIDKFRSDDLSMSNLKGVATLSVGFKSFTVAELQQAMDEYTQYSNQTLLSGQEPQSFINHSLKIAADKALYRAKKMANETGKNTFVSSSPTD
ncbi:MAG: Diguanylate cyclase/phosphodiesterase (GGDEF & EAL domain) with PAS/PAC and GAF sensor(S) [Candidatus Amesbacteria bacterium GW2011_GWA2_42_12]|uniref:Diguanylate cyclase/phosphodiesterase (GGDEF & EAL domain) with PAS/PAC and GAF sensor(S) n=1 Tax=Candidatus Amesbacteria bacterium GW2011_GWA2_42_12 TaxID=1618356 RepID=A0A0G0Y8E8_9BACT|nr:MAG: Diguanylate cyclase/phosphodiesterase (GGDEF & EAL domain) with PAS/PAC and GAF sensor(S) [Candidatus Amesbacteria bacterium GW2011_GWA2_42_12]